MNSSGISWLTRSLSNLVERLLEVNVHAACGIEAQLYRNLWPMEVPFPGSASERLLPVLVDRCVGRDRDARTEAGKVMDAAQILPYHQISRFMTTGDAAKTEEFDRYVMFVRLDPDRRGWTPGDLTLHKFETHLNVLEGAFLAIQYPDLLDTIGYDCAGSYLGEPNNVASFDRRKGRTFLHARNVDRAQPHVLCVTRHRYFAPI